MGIKTVDLNLKYDILKNVNLDFKKNKFSTIIGLNGVGKTSLLKAICALFEFSGEIYLDDLLISKMKAYQLSKQISYVSQNNYLDISLSVRDYLNLNEVVLSDELLIKKLSLFGIENLLNKDFKKLSKGQQQLVTVTRSLLQNNDYLILDEADSALDMNNKYLMYDVLKKLNKTIIATIHDLNVSLSYSDYLYIIVDKEEIIELDLTKISKEKLLSNLSKIYPNIEIIGDEKMVVTYVRNKSGS